MKYYVSDPLTTEINFNENDDRMFKVFFQEIKLYLKVFKNFEKRVFGILHPEHSLILSNQQFLHRLHHIILINDSILFLGIILPYSIKFKYLLRPLNERNNQHRCLIIAKSSQ